MDEGLEVVWVMTLPMALIKEIIGLAMRFCSGYSATRRYVADASYWLYLIHLPLIMALQVALSRLDWPWWMKFPLILGIAFPILFASYQYLVRYSFIGAILNGRRESPRRRTTQRPVLPEITS